MHPTYWPEVRRGAERLIHDLAARLAAAGDDVTLLTTHEGPAASESEDGFRVERRRRLPTPLVARRGYEPYLGAAPGALAGLLRGKYDVVHALYAVEGWVAAQVRARGGPPVVFSVNGIPVRRGLVGRRYTLPLMAGAARGADACTVLSEAAADGFRRYLLREPEIVPGAIDCAQFTGDALQAPVPTVVCGASLDDPRKRGALLLRAFTALREERPDARLVLAGPGAARLEPFPPGVEARNCDHTPELANAYASAWVSVLPSVDEAFGLVLLESMAAGTPVVAARSGGCPAIVDAPGLGRLFEPDDENDLVRALDEALELSQRTETARACRERAAEYDWSNGLPRFRSLYERVAEQR